MTDNEDADGPEENSGDAQISLLGEISPVCPPLFLDIYLSAGQVPEHSLPGLDSGQNPGVEIEEGDDGNNCVEERARDQHSAGVDQGQAEGAGGDPTGWDFVTTNINI